MMANKNHPWSLSQLHLLLTLECKYECDHCFVKSGPGQGHTMDCETIGRILDEAEGLGTIEWIYFEGGEPFMFYDLLLWGVREANRRGFRVGVVSNAYWADDHQIAMEQLRPFAGLVEDLSISDDAYHGSGEEPGNTHIARQAASELGIPVDFISITGPDCTKPDSGGPQMSSEEGSVCYRGRAADKLAPLVMHRPWETFSMGNLLETPLKQIMENYDPDGHPVIGPLLRGGPAELVRQFGLEHATGYADACHLCYFSRRILREEYPDILTPEQMY